MGPLFTVTMYYFTWHPCNFLTEEIIFFVCDTMKLSFQVSRAIFFPEQEFPQTFHLEFSLGEKLVQEPVMGSRVLALYH